MGRSLPGTGAQAGLRLDDLSLIFADASGRVVDECELAGRTLEDGFTWLAEATTRHGEKLPRLGVVRTNYDLPVHAIASGAAFSGAGADSRMELARWFANGQAELEGVASDIPGASEVRCWPHHFDVGALVVVAEKPDGSLAKSIGIGLSPGDESYAEPYWYVSPWPYPEADALEPLSGSGAWHSEGHTSAILTATQLLDGPPDEQRDRLHAFIASAVGASRRILAA